jgi:EAL domain-containing protein (putative c-di-GMP-specific phosphodiesterase class I)
MTSMRFAGEFRLSANKRNELILDEEISIKLNQLILMRAIDVLTDNPAYRLACTISHTSMRSDANWDVIFSRLADNVALARRLIVQLDDTLLLSIAPVRAFATRLRQCGCLLGVCGFGGKASGLGCCAFVLPDIVELHPSLLWRARDSSAAAMQLRSFLALAREMTSDVVVSGVAGEADVRLAAACGAEWFHGPYVPVSVPF